MSKKRKFEKWIGYCFTHPNGHEVVLDDLYEYEDGRNCYEMKERMDDGSYKKYICDYSTFKEIWKNTLLPKA